MAFKTMVTAVQDGTADAAVLSAAMALAEGYGAHLDVLALGIAAEDPALFYAGPHAMPISLGMDDGQAAAAALAAELAPTLETWGRSAAAAPYAVPMLGLPHLMADRARLADLAIAAQPYGPDRGPIDAALVEALLFAAGVPLVTVPDGGGVSATPGSVVLAWNESDEALRALRAALPILQRAERVHVALVEPRRHAAGAADPGHDISVVLARHGVMVDVALLPRTMPRVADTLLRFASDQGAELMVMGAYGHSRLRETLLGGATRDLLEAATLPLFLCH